MTIPSTQVMNLALLTIAALLAALLLFGHKTKGPKLLHSYFTATTFAEAKRQACELVVRGEIGEVEDIVFCEEENKWYVFFSTKEDVS